MKKLRRSGPQSPPPRTWCSKWTACCGKHGRKLLGPAALASKRFASGRRIGTSVKLAQRPKGPSCAVQERAQRPKGPSCAVQERAQRPKGPSCATYRKTRELNEQKTGSC